MASERIEEVVNEVEVNEVSSDLEMKVVIRGLPFEASEEEVLEFFQIDASQLNLPKFSDSGRCKGFAFITCQSEDEVGRIKTMGGDTFTAGANARQISVSDYEERPKRQRKNRRRRGGNRENSENTGDTGTGGTGGRPERSNEDRSQQSFQASEESEREVYVSNVPFDADEEDFRRVFGDCGEIEEITIPTIYTSGRPKGFAFVRFADAKSRDEALTLNQTNMLNRTIGVRVNKGRAIKTSNRDYNRTRHDGLSEKPERCTTIFVGNLPWDTTEDDLQEQFEDCGKITSARIVKQTYTGRSRGFGYVEFQDEASVDTAVQQARTLGGRELRIDYAESQTEPENENEETLEED